jgi:hypothetical protein
MKEFIAVSYLFSPLLVGLITHGLCIKFSWLTFLRHPIDRGCVFRSKPIFGPNKTYRGLIAVGLGTAIGLGLQANVFHRLPSIQHIELFNYSPAKALLLGFFLGVAAMLSELPNSFLKRQFNIAPGNPASGLSSLLFYSLDQVDFLIGAWLILAIVIEVTLSRVLWSLVFIFVSHQIITSIGYLLGMRATPR